MRQGGKLWLLPSSHFYSSPCFSLSSGHILKDSDPPMFNNLLKKASESSFVALANEALDNSRPGSPAATASRRPPGSPLTGQPHQQERQQQAQQQNGASTPARKAWIKQKKRLAFLHFDHYLLAPFSLTNFMHYCCFGCGKQ